MMAYIFHLKKAFLLLLLFAASLGVCAQEEREFKNMLGVSPFRTLIFRELGIKYERSLSSYPRRTFGAFLTVYSDFALWGQGIHIEPFIRYYYREAPKGFYFQMKIIGGIYSQDTSVAFKIRNDNSVQYLCKTQTYTGGGLGFAGGYQFKLNDRWTIDVNLGLKIMGHNRKSAAAMLDDDNAEIFGNYEEIPEQIADFFGPRHFIDGLISIGYRF